MWEQPCSNIQVLIVMEIALNLLPLMIFCRFRYPPLDLGMLNWLNHWTLRRKHTYFRECVVRIIMNLKKYYALFKRPDLTCICAIFFLIILLMYGSWNASFKEWCIVIYKSYFNSVTEFGKDQEDFGNKCGTLIFNVLPVNEFIPVFEPSKQNVTLQESLPQSVLFLSFYFFFEIRYCVYRLAL